MISNLIKINSKGSPPRIAVIGTGIAGLSAAWELRDIAELTLFESSHRPGGHSNTITLDEEGSPIPIDTGFIVFNKITYPNLCRLFDQLGINAVPSEMSLSVRHIPAGLEYNGMGLNKLFAQRRNIARPKFIRLIMEIMRFFRVGRQWLQDEADGDISHEVDEDLSSFCKRHRFSADFLDLYLVPMSAAVWSTEPSRILDFPASTLLHFFHNHGFLGISTHHPWFTVEGGAITYVQKMLGVLGTPRLGDPVIEVLETPQGALVQNESGKREHFDAVVLACHANQSLRLLHTPTTYQQRLLTPFQYQVNEALLHSDSSVMPDRRLAWASWNFKVEQISHHRRASTHYWMNALQGVSKKRNYFVSLNSNQQINPKSVHYATTYEHPIFTLEAIRAQQELPKLNHTGCLFFCGSYFRYGFHEDACKSGFEAAAAAKKYFML